MQEVVAPSTFETEWEKVCQLLPGSWTGPGLRPEFGGIDEGGMPTGSWVASAYGPDEQVEARGDGPSEALDALALALGTRSQTRAAAIAGVDPGQAERG